MFPTTHRECVVTPQNLLLISGMVKSSADIEEFERILQGEQTAGGDKGVAESLKKTAFEKCLNSGKTTSYFPRISQITLEALSRGNNVALVDMPEVLLRMKIASEYSLDDLKAILNDILTKVFHGRSGPDLPDACALYHHAEIFQKPRDDYVAALLHTLAKDEEEKYDSMLCYLGNVNVKPVSRLVRSG
jgi:hypothetical protein